MLSESLTDVVFPFAFDYTYDGFPQEIAIFFDAEFLEKRPHITLTWHTPDGRAIQLDELTVQGSAAYYASQDERLGRNFAGQETDGSAFWRPQRRHADPATWSL